MPKVIATADLHGSLPEIPDCNLLIIGGDICPNFISHSLTAGFGYAERVHNGQPQQAKWLDTTFREWLNEKAQRGIEVVGIAGNHDFVFERPFLIPDELPWTYLQDSGATILGLEIYGTPWVPALPSWAFYGNDEFLQTRVNDIPAGLDILISHGPPRGYGDFVRGAGQVGDLALSSSLTRLAPRVVVCGHIHEGYGSYDHIPSSTAVYNVAHNTAHYDPINPPVEIVEFTYE